jgi:hypothetical protein
MGNKWEPGVARMVVAKLCQLVMGSDPLAEDADADVRMFAEAGDLRRSSLLL